jgi:hypothetical protein
MDAYDRLPNLGVKVLPILLPSMVEAENFSDHLRICRAGDITVNNHAKYVVHG